MGRKDNLIHVPGAGAERFRQGLSQVNQALLENLVGALNAMNESAKVLAGATLDMAKTAAIAPRFLELPSGKLLQVGRCALVCHQTDGRVRVVTDAGHAIVLDEADSPALFGYLLAQGRVLKMQEPGEDEAEQPGPQPVEDEADETGGDDAGD